LDLVFDLTIHEIIGINIIHHGVAAQTYQACPHDYRPLGLGNVMYQLMAKLTTNRLQPYMDRIIAPTQITFIRGHNIANNVILM
jgi:hypothetical protein